MSPFDLNQVSIIPLEEGERDLGHIPPSTLADHTSSFSCPNPLSSRHDQIADHCLGHRLQEPQQRPKEQFLIDRSSDHMTQHPSDTEDDYTVKLPLCDPEVREGESDRPGKWMSSKMRFMRKMMNSTHIVVSKPRGSMLVAEDQSQANQGFGTSNQSSSSPSGGNIRVCSDCNTTKTPLWRSGPRGPKSLCNACGIRQRKARRAMAAAALNGGLIPATAPAKVRKVKKLDIDRTLPFKKRCKVDTANTTAKKLCFDEVRLSSSKKNTAIQKVFPQEERDAAILLMALSCGLIRS